MEEISLRRANTLHPIIRQKVIDAVNHINRKLLGKRVRLRIAYGLRTKDEQTRLFNQGRTVLFDANGKRLGKVTNAQWWQTIHFYGLAFDIVVLYDKDDNGTFEVASWDLLKDFDGDGKAEWREAIDYLKSVGFEWGGDWKRFKDAPHFQAKKPNGQSYNWRELKALIDSGQTFIENGITYPKL